MFESDDFDQVLSQFDFPEDISNLKREEHKNDHEQTNSTESKQLQHQHITCQNILNKKTSKTNTNINTTNNNTNNLVVKDMVSPKHMKRKMIHSYFDHKNKRKFPGPAGLLTGDFEENKDETICQMELLSQDVDFSQNSLRGDIFESPLWIRLLDDLKSWNLHNVDTIKNIKQQSLKGSLRRRKAQTVIVFVETVDRSATDPLIIMRDTTGNIKGTLHRDAWSTFSQYIASEFCAFILWKPTILTTGAAFKKHYLNITLSNILAIYSSTVLKDEPDVRPMPEGYAIVYEDDYTVIKTENSVQNIGTNDTLSNGFDVHDNEANDLLDGLDSIFSDDVF